jgi:intracellular multiplication protein IcmV
MGKVSKVFKSMIDVPAWMGAATLKDSAKGIKELGQAVFRPQQAQHDETYEQAIERMGLKAEHLEKRQRGLLIASIIYFLTALVFISYTLYLFWRGAHIAVLLSAVLSLVALSLSVRENFWYYQMRERRLGCTLGEWFFFLLGKRTND